MSGWDEEEEPLPEYFQQLRREYLIEAPARLGELRKDLAALRASEPDAADSLKSRFHKLAGSGGSYGFPAITTAAREAEEWLGEHPAPDDGGFAFLGGAIGRIAAAFDDAVRELGYPEDSRKPPAFGWRALLVGRADLVAGLDGPLRDAGYAVSQIPLDAEPAAQPVSERPDLVVIAAGPGGDPAAAAARWLAGPFERLPVAVVADPAELDLLGAPLARLSLVTPPERAAVDLAGWGRAVARAGSAPLAALAVLSEAAEREELTAWLEAAGVRVVTTDDARLAAATLEREVLDAVLVDWDLPGGQGEALVRLLRRSARSALIPVLALASDDSDPVREAALAAGVDELLARPSGQSRLVPALLQRAGRARRLDEARRYDPLTGLLTAGGLADELERVLAQARRDGEPLCLLLLDVDHFRRLNEQLGYGTGDRILLHLTRVMRGRIRASDLLVRVGGEEFGVLLRRCEPAQAMPIAEALRAAVSADPPIVEGTPMPVRLSGGIAGYPAHASTARGLLLAAERATKEAKETGRDRIVAS